MVREGSFSPNKKETRAYLIRDLQMECDCKSLEIMRVKIYMLIPKLVTLRNTVKWERKIPWDFWSRTPENSSHGLPCGNGITCTRSENSQLHTVTENRSQQITPEAMALQLVRLQQSTQHWAFIFFYESRFFLRAVLKLWRVTLQWLWKYSFFLLS